MEDEGDSESFACIAIMRADERLNNIEIGRTCNEEKWFHQTYRTSQHDLRNSVLFGASCNPVNRQTRIFALLLAYEITLTGALND